MISAAYTDPLVGAYYLATRRSRQRELAERAETAAAPVMAVFYHRVADAFPNDWTISTERFKAQINWIRHRFEIISLIEAQQRIGAGGNRTPAVCITFDDGYADNCRDALPWLLDERIPFTYFVAVEHVLHNRPFDHDVKRGCPLPPNTPEDIRILADSGVEIGAHTSTHIDLGAATADQTYDEIVGSKHDLERITRRAVRYFAFPYGMHANLTAAAFQTAFRAGYWGVCSAYGGYNLPGDDPFHIQRFHGDPGWGRFCNWMSFDPRKQKSVCRFNPGDYRSGF